MNAIELAELLDDTSPWVASNHGWEAAAMLRDQHEAIVKLRKALRRMASIEGKRLRGDGSIDIYYEHQIALQTLNETEHLCT